jgi:hypothetical protein
MNIKDLLLPMIDKRSRKAGGRRQEAGFWRELELPLLTFPLQRGGLYRVGYNHQFIPLKAVG